MTGVRTVLVLGLAVARPGWIPPYLPGDAEVRRVLGALDNFDTGPRILTGYGAALFPAYSRLLRDSDLPVGRRACIFSIVARVNGDRGRFLESVAYSAAETLAAIGDRRALAASSWPAWRSPERYNARVATDWEPVEGDAVGPKAIAAYLPELRE